MNPYSAEVTLTVTFPLTADNPEHACELARNIVNNTVVYGEPSDVTVSIFDRDEQRSRRVHPSNGKRHL